MSGRKVRWMNNLDGYGTVEYGIESIAHALNKSLDGHCSYCPCANWCYLDETTECEKIFYEFVKDNICGLCPEPSKSTSDEIRPQHYKIMPNVEVMDVISAILDRTDYTPSECFMLGNVIKYVLRADQKNGTEDYRKAVTYLKALIESREKVE